MTHSPADRHATWRDVLRAPEGDEAYGALALGVEVRQRTAADSEWWVRRSVASATPAGLRRRSDDVTIGVRPLERSARTGEWVKGGVSWELLRRPGSPFAAAHVRWFTDLHAIARPPGALTAPADSSEWVTLDHSESAVLWPHLRAAAALGIPIVAVRSHTDVRLASEAALHVDIAQETDGSLALSTYARLDGEDVAPADILPLGASAAAAYRVDGERIRLVLGPLALDARARALVAAPAPVVVPAGDVAEFLRDDVPRLARSARLAGTGGYELPDLPAVELVVTATNRPGHRLDVSVHWHEAGFGERAWADEETTPTRESAFGRRVTAAVIACWPEIAQLREAEARASTMTVHGAATPHVVTHVLPALARIEGVRVTVHGTPAEYRELLGAPEITLTSVESTDPDWFDLGILVTIDGTRIPFTPLFTALSQRRTTMMLVDGSWFSLRHRALDRLRELIDESVTLDEWEAGPRVSRYQVSVWEDFEDLADVAEPAVSWRRSADALRGLDAVPATSPPALVTATLRPYQQAGLDWLALLWRHRLGGILADDMGLGKTLQLLALIAHTREAGERRPFLVVAPTSVLSTWHDEAAAYAEGLRVVIVDETASASRTDLAARIAAADVVVTSYTLVRLDAAAYGATAWAGLILDEAQMVKNAQTRTYQAVKDLQADVVFAVTGTPMENRLDELWALLSLATPGLFPSSRAFREQYVLPLEHGKVPENAEGAAFTTERLQRLRRRVRPFLLRRTKDLVAPELPPRQEQIVHVDLDPAHRALYDITLQRERQKVLGLLPELDRHRFIVFRSITLLRLLSLAPALVPTDGENGPTHEDIPASKLDVLLARVSGLVAEGRRMLVFSQFTSFLALVGERLDAAGIPFAQLDGSTSDRGRVVEAFRGGDAPVFLISLRAGGFGLTLTEADAVFLLDPWWNPAVEAQAVDRTHRIGQTRPVNVYRLVARDTIEEKVLALQ